MTDWLEFENRTPHEIVLRLPDGTERVYPPCGVVARVATYDEHFDSIDGVPIITRIYDMPTGMPDDDRPVLVSALVAAACPNRRGVYSPDTGPTAIRDDRGQIVAVTQLVVAYQRTT